MHSKLYIINEISDEKSEEDTCVSLDLPQDKGSRIIKVLKILGKTVYSLQQQNIKRHKMARTFAKYV